MYNIDKITMCGFFIFNLISVILAKQVQDYTISCEDTEAGKAAGYLLMSCSTCLGASLVCTVSPCKLNKYTMGLITIFSIMSLVCASIVHNKCEDARKATTPLIIINVLLLATSGVIGITTAHQAGLIDAKTPFVNAKTHLTKLGNRIVASSRPGENNGIDMQSLNKFNF